MSAEDRNPARTSTAPRLGRRRFLAAGAARATAGLGASAARAEAGKENLPPNVPEWTKTLGAGVGDRPYGTRSPHENHIVRRTVDWLTATKESSVSFTPIAEQMGIITPSGLHFERHHAGRAEVDPKAHRLIVHGLVEREMIFTVDELKRFPSISVVRFVECPANGGMEWRGAQLERCQYVRGMVSCSEWTGVSLKTLLRETGLKSTATWMLAEGADSAAMTRSVPIAKVLDDAMICWGQNGEAIRPEQGYPIRLLLPGWEGNMSVKWLRRLEFGDQPWHTREETSKYTDLMPDGKAREFTWFMEANSVVTYPSPERPFPAKGFHEMQGFAWSGLGTIKRVDVSVDGGRNWTTAKLQDPVYPKALTRWTMPFDWNGQPLLVMSRAQDETGYVQPAIADLRRIRGTNSIYHNNSMITWQVKAGGEVENVQLK
ncbi:MAG: sulfite dehydrogenase [Rhodospirillaceae bacterium]|nr:sulfite dehydrogenase [Rhodospirillaceae bacterium]